MHSPEAAPVHRPTAAAHDVPGGMGPSPSQPPTARAAAPSSHPVQLTPVPRTPAVALPVQRRPATPSVPPQPAVPVALPPPPLPAARRRTAPSHPPTSHTPSPPPTTPTPKDADDGAPSPHTSAEFDARALSGAQIDELTHRLIGPLTRLLRTELRLDRERIGKLRDPRR
ncbi:extensin [Streptomyces sp. NPDC051907]|uniref:extensin n=1 Tax=Streptomyces sp. NPDC051907 TaxID=3155284 RepID=UPI00341707BB